MQITRASSPARRWIVAGGAAALALGAGMTTAGAFSDLPGLSEAEAKYEPPVNTGEREAPKSLAWSQIVGPRVSVKDLGGGSAQARLAGEEESASRVLGLTPGDTDTSRAKARDETPISMGVTETTPGRADVLDVEQRSRPASMELTPGDTDASRAKARTTSTTVAGGEKSSSKGLDVTPGGIDASRAKARDETPISMGVTETTPGRADVLDVEQRSRPASMELTPGDTDASRAKARTSSTTVAGGEKSSSKGLDVTPGGIDASRAKARDETPISMGVTETTPGRADVLSNKRRIGPASMDVTPGDADALSEVRRVGQPLLAGDGRSWSVFATFPEAENEIVLFNDANRLSLSTIKSFPRPWASLDLSGFILDIDVMDLGNRRLALVSMGREGIAVVDVSAAAQPRLVAEIRGHYLPDGLSFTGTGAEEVLPGVPAAILSLASDGSTVWILDADYGLQSTTLESLGLSR